MMHTARLTPGLEFPAWSGYLHSKKGRETCKLITRGEKWAEVLPAQALRYIVKLKVKEQKMVKFE